MRYVALLAALAACTAAPPARRVVVTVPPPPAVTAHAPVSWPVDWANRTYDLTHGLWELSGTLRAGRGVFNLDYHDGGMRDVPVRLASVRRYGELLILRFVDDPPAKYAYMTKWYAFFRVQRGRPKLVGAFPASADLRIDGASLSLVKGSCTRDVVVGPKVEIARGQSRPTGY